MANLVHPEQSSKRQPNFESLGGVGLLAKVRPGIQQTWCAFDLGPERLLEHQLCVDFFQKNILGPLQQSALVKEGLARILVFVVKEGLVGILVFFVKEGLAEILVFVPSYFNFVRASASVGYFRLS
ncbi:uncharacterized protein PGTG_22459 [Puccinia graminis f. sp. tritici CRL 75-36-700-3]|uniref:Uncharacterized protein n=1 Tax=Puccinia graminis f. sp. tritici (strain CRL 75-36-700-3 / race SCCL) TaxID=418459 RepID=H6QUL8_PUCGT|nr:uncharacterized protein PGTG_22459 [Puccinia graminis f. sp. tritici CRL 75-36-700-3]EHS64734.1 hypothetical protein PGTG_22459 [Puccinia graminis f. sp. tritici CRL 75-36-700-3]